MINIKNILLDRLKWKPEHEYRFSIPESDTNEYFPEKNLNIPKNIYQNISQNLDYIKSRFNIWINSDIVLREFVIFFSKKKYKAFLLFIDGMVDSNLINNYVLKPLMNDNNTTNYNLFKKNNIMSEQKKNDVIIRKIKKIDISKYILATLMPQNSVQEVQSFDIICSAVNSGDCALFIDTLNIAYDIDVKGFKQRSVEPPNNEVVIKGPQEAFVENIRTNTSLLRRIINTENLIIENIEIGSVTKTKWSICYMSNITNNNLVAEVKYRLNNLQIDSLMSSRSTRRTYNWWKPNWNSWNSFNRKTW